MTSPLFGQLAVTGTAQRLTANVVAPLAFTIKASSKNLNPVFVGDSTVTLTTGYQLDPGDQLDYEVQLQNGQAVFQLRPSDFWVVGTAPDVVTWLGSPQ